MKWSFELDTVTLDRFEVPEHFDLGHHIKTIEHDFIDEVGQPRRRVHALGAFPVPSTWKGILYSGDNGDQAINRAVLLDNLAIAQKEFVWKWGPRHYRAFIKKFIWTPHHQNEIEYDIELVVLYCLNGQTCQPDRLLAYDSATQQFYVNARSAVDSLKTLTGLKIPLPASLTAATDAVDTAMRNASPIGSQSVETIQSVLTTLNEATTELTDYESPLEDLAILAADCAALDYAFQAVQNYGLVSKNLAQIIGATLGAQIVQGFVGSIFDLAAKWYPNADAATAASAIAQANKINDLFVDNPTDMAIPALFSNA